MRKAPEPRALIDAAEKAAGAGDYASAETLLRDAARAQEASLGPLHPDLANTLNNLGVVCEITGKAVDAEQYFRRALTIATTALDPEHPFVITSRTNLRDFCEVRGIPLDVAKPAPEEAVKPAPEEPVKPAPEAKPYDPVAESKRLFTRLALGALGPIAMLMIVLSAGLPRLGALDHATSPPPIPVDSPPAPVAVDAQPDPAPAPAKESVEPVTTTPQAQTPERPMVVDARLCASLDDWLCDPTDRPVPPGQLFFFTRVLSGFDTTVQHRWYLNNRLYYTVDLRILASPAIGYRAFSRNRMSGESAGSWRIEVRTEDGTLLHEERFIVR
jgi:Protein of unknown function (DUF2914)/Tetratricopeptide repeat